MLCAIYIWLLLLVGLHLARAADPPVAIVVTNGDYDIFSLRLHNVAADGVAFSNQLIRAGFLPSRVLRYQNLDFSQFHTLVSDAAKKYANVSSLVFYYSGHGILYNGHARLLPTDFSIVDLASTVRHRSVTDQTIAVEDITKIGAATGIPELFVFDACRDDGTSAGMGNFFARVMAIDLTQAAKGAGSTVPAGRLGTFDNQGDQRVLIDPQEQLGHDNSLVMLAAVRSRWGPGISYALPNKPESEFTASLLSAIHQWPNRGLNEIFPLVKSEVVSETAGLTPPQLPFEIDHTYGSVKLENYANPSPAISAAPIFAPIGTRTKVSTAGAYLEGIRQWATVASATKENYVFSAPFKLSGVSIPALADRLQQTAGEAEGKIVNGLQSVSRPLATSAEVAANARLVARLWDPALDERVYGIGGTSPPVHIPSPSTITRALANGTIEYTQTITADPGFRILSVRASPSVAKNLLDFDTRYSLDSDGITSEVKIWHLPAGENGKADGDFSADLSVRERRPQGSIVRPLTALLGLRPNQNIVLALTGDQIKQLDSIQLVSSSGAVLAEVRLQQRVPLPGTDLAISLSVVYGHPLLQIEPAH